MIDQDFDEDGFRVTRRACEKIAQSLAQSIFLSKLIHIPWKKKPKNLGYYFQKPAQSKQSPNSRKIAPIDKKSPNLVTLGVIKALVGLASL
jgi:hypothetical protein